MRSWCRASRRRRGSLSSDHLRGGRSADGVCDDRRDVRDERTAQLHHPLFTHEAFLDSSDDKFFVYIEAKDEKFDMERTRKLLEETGADRIDVIEDE